MEKNNIFDGAYLGKQYRTRDGRKAILISYNQRKPMEPYVCAVACYLDDSIKSNCYNFNEFGRRRTDLISDSDIVAEWHEEINDEEVDSLAAEWVADNGKVYVIEEDVMELTNFDTARAAYKAGYRKAKEE